MPRTPASAQKRQTRLSFATLPASSTLSSGLSPARVRIASLDSPSPTKRRKVIADAESLPTPAPSSQIDDRRSTRSSTGRAGHSDKSFMKSKPTKTKKRTSASKHCIDFGDSESEEEVSGHAPRSSPPIVLHSDQDPDSENANSESEDDDDLPQTRRRNPAPQTQQEEDDLKEDLDFLRSYSPPPERQHTNSAKSARQQALDALKRRRSEHNQDIRSPTQRRPVVIESDDDVESPDQSAEDNDAATMFQADESDEGFLDDEHDVGAAPALPLEFSNYRTMKPQELFKFIIEWMVQKKINPAFAMEDEVYTLAFRRLDDFVRGLGGSKYQSSAWTPQFTNSLRTRPKLVDSRLSTGMATIEHDRCDACNRSGHPATWEAKFTGRTYDSETFENDSEDDDDDNDDDDDEDNEESDDENAVIYYVGKTCMSNARIAHALAHWKYALMQWVIEYLKDEGHLDPRKIVKRDSWSTRRRRQYAESVVDEMVANGQIKTLHREFRTSIDDAQQAGNDTGWDHPSP